jgi:hypothetical protein
MREAREGRDRAPVRSVRGARPAILVTGNHIQRRPHVMSAADEHVTTQSRGGDVPGELARARI